MPFRHVHITEDSLMPATQLVHSQSSLSHRLAAEKHPPHAEILAAGSDTSRNCSCCEIVRVSHAISAVSAKSSHCAAAHQRSAERQLVGELQIAAHRQARRDARHSQSGDVTQHPHQIRRGRLALGVRIRRDDHLGDVHTVDPFANPVEQLANPQLLGSHPGQRIQCATEYVVTAAEFTGALDGLHIFRFLDNAHQRCIATRIAADATAVLVGDVAAHRTKFHAVAHLAQNCGEPINLWRLHRQQMKRDPLRALRPDAGQLAELVDQILDGAFEHLSTTHIPGRPRPPIPPASGPSLSCARMVTCLDASAMAPTMRSCSVSTSEGSTTFGSIETATTSPLPFMVTCTSPPPAWPWTSAPASASCASINCCCTCCACARSADISGWPPPGCMTGPLAC